MARRQTVTERPRFLKVVVGAVLAFLYVPVAIVVVFSFNSGKNLYEMQGLSLRWYQELLANQTMMESLWLSLWVACVVAMISVVAGLGIALAISRTAKWFGGSLQGFVLLRVVTPETATGVAVLLLFTQSGVPLSSVTLILSHASMCAAFAAIIIMSRLATLNKQYEEAAMDLGASMMGTIWYVIIPLLRPAMVGAALLSFVLSFTNFITSFFASGIGATPLPVRIYSMLRVGVTPMVNAAGVVMLVITVLAIVLAYLALRMMSHRSQRLKTAKSITQ